jgi:hypothetical protein
MLGGGLAAAVLLVGGLGIAVLRGVRPLDVANAPPAGTTAVVVMPPATVDDADKPDPSSPRDAPAADASPRLAQKPLLETGHDAESISDNPTPTNAVPATAQATEPVTAQSIESDHATPAEADDQSATATAHLATNTEPLREPVLRLDPLDFDPVQISLNATAGASHGEPSASVPAIAPDEAALTRDESGPQPEGAGLLAIPGESPSVTVRLGPIARGAANPTQLERQFGLRLETLSSTGMSLEQFVAFVSDLAGVPITIDPLALELAGVSSRATVAAQTGGVTLEELAQSTLSTQRLELVDREGRFGVALAKSGERSTKQYEVSDLLKPAVTDAGEVARAVERFVSPKSWQAGGGKGTVAVEGTKLRVNQTKEVHHELLIFCERWRLARRLAQRSQYPAKLLSLESPYSQVEAKLSERTTFTFLPWTRMDEVVRHWEQATGLTILVDWGRLADAELSPSTPIACSAIDRPWGEALNEIFEPLGLAWWAVDGQTIQITTRSALDAIVRVEFYAIPPDFREQFASSKAFVEALQSELRQHLGDNAPGAQPDMHVDAPSGRLIVRGTPLVHRYLAKRLTSLAGE